MTMNVRKRYLHVLGHAVHCVLFVNVNHNFYVAQIVDYYGVHKTCSENKNVIVKCGKALFISFLS